MTPPDIERGYRIVANVLDASETADLRRSLEQSALERSRAGARHLMHHPSVSVLARDPRLLAIATAFVGPDAVPYRATLFDKSPSRNWLVPWHQDTALPLEQQRDVPGWGPWSVKAGVTYAHAPADVLARVVALRLHFDESGPDNGPLRVVPGTHTLGVLTDETVSDLVERSRPCDCLIGAGGVIAMRPLIVHASSKSISDRPRRVLHLEYIDSLDVGAGLRVAIA
jgi:ectoine hydroxylase-related dioxygenase (phytanoyl-CoA dioxygenase family)